MCIFSCTIIVSEKYRIVYELFRLYETDTIKKDALHFNASENIIFYFVFINIEGDG